MGDVGKDSSEFIENVCLVENMKHNLPGSSQLCDKGCRVIFYKTKCVIENACNGKVFFFFVRKRCDNVYTIDIDCALTLDKCFYALHDDT